ncbi:MAG: acyltransferase [Flavobacteriales bacterium]|nr:acyltransferase [Flavobacteriales bacterium]
MNAVPWHRRLLDFWLRRWLRTLPNYYLFLAVNIALVLGGIASGVVNRNTWAYALFLQNLWKPIDLFFPESWSLVVEEWFYLLLPLMLFCAMVVTRAPSRHLFPAIGLLFIVAPMAMRFFMAADIESLWHMEHGLRKLAITRLDAIGWGVLAAWLRACFPGAWFAGRWPLLTIGLGLVLYCALAYGADRLAFSATHYFTLNAIGATMLLPALSAWNNQPRWGRAITFISVVSYALYLTHQPVRYIFNRWFVVEQGTSLFMLLVLYWCACIAISWVVWRYWECRFMAMRSGFSRRLAAGV